MPYKSIITHLHKNLNIKCKKIFEKNIKHLFAFYEHLCYNRGAELTDNGKRYYHEADNPYSTAYI